MAIHTPATPMAKIVFFKLKPDSHTSYSYGENQDRGVTMMFAVQKTSKCGRILKPTKKKNPNISYS